MGGYDWWVEYFRVALAYVVLIYGYPSVLFRNYLKGRGRTFRFGFCVTAGMMLVSTAVILLGLAHLLNVWVVRLLFYGSLIWSVSGWARMSTAFRRLVYKVHNRTYGGRLLAVRSLEALIGAVRRGLAALWGMLRKDLVEVAVFFALLVYGVLYFSWNPIHTRGYGFSDIIVHHSWACGLQRGKVFVDGIYPEGMHCVAYAVSALFGIELYNVILFLQCANMSAFLGSLYLFFREVAGWKGSALVMLASFLTVKLDTVTEIYIMSRLQTCLPQEFGLYTVFLIPTFLMRYLKNAGQVTFRGRKTRFYWDENLVVFTLGIAASISIHFYDTVMALFSCLGVIVVWLFKIIHWRRLVPLAASALLAVALSFGPMLLAFASGIPFQNSIFWALNVMKPTGETSEAASDVSAQTQETKNDSLTQGTEDSSQEMEAASMATEPMSAAPRSRNLTERLSDIWRAILRRVQKIADGVYYGSLQTLYDGQWVQFFVRVGQYALGLSVGYRLLTAALRRRFPGVRFPAELFDGYAMVVVIAVVFLMAFSPGRTGFPQLIAPDRVCAAGHGFLMCLITLPVDLAGILLTLLLGRKNMSALSGGAVGLAVYLVISGGCYHGFLYLCGTRYNAAVDVTASIVREFPKEQFTIVSTTDELYQGMDDGFHEEILTFQKNCGGREYYIPTRYLFFFVEKRPILYGHAHFCDGPGWLAQQRYHKQFRSSSVGEQMTGGEISDGIAEKPLILDGKLSNAYTRLPNREIVESRMARALRRLEKAYPNEWSVYYEDGDFVCYCLEQNPNRLFNLGEP